MKTLVQLALGCILFYAGASNAQSSAGDLKNDGVRCTTSCSTNIQWRVSNMPGWSMTGLVTVQIPNSPNIGDRSEKVFGCSPASAYYTSQPATVVRGLQYVYKLHWTIGCYFSGADNDVIDTITVYQP